MGSCESSASHSTLQGAATSGAPGSNARTRTWAGGGTSITTSSSPFVGVATTVCHCHDAMRPTKRPGGSLPASNARISCRSPGVRGIVCSGPLWPLGASASGSSDRMSTDVGSARRPGSSQPRSKRMRPTTRRRDSGTTSRHATSSVASSSGCRVISPTAWCFQSGGASTRRLSISISMAASTSQRPSGTLAKLARDSASSDARMEAPFQSRRPIFAGSRAPSAKEPRTRSSCRSYGADSAVPSPSPRMCEGSSRSRLVRSQRRTVASTPGGFPVTTTVSCAAGTSFTVRGPTSLQSISSPADE